MLIKKLLAVAAMAAAVWPAAASAQGQVDPPGGDDYTTPVTISAFDDPQPLPAAFGFDANTSKYTLQDDMFDPPGHGGPREPRRCGDSTYSKTIWTVFHADRKGAMTVSASGGFDAVIAFIPFGNPKNDGAPHLEDGVCIDASPTHDEELKVEVEADHWYAVQVGGTGKPAGGDLALRFRFTPAGQQPVKTLRMALQVVGGHSVSGGAKLSKLILARQKSHGKLLGPSPRGASVAVRCKRGCRSKSFKLKGNALRFRYLENKLLPAGTKFVVRVTRRNPLARGQQWTVSVGRTGRIHVSRPKIIDG